ncbi:hypothetical protein [Pseudomonas lurida]|uniref:hypothetical protein n=1 Tax=Pseudomonas lurida TaxID=244566 RepID=UPI0011454777|nr:hypothetical protein [Pseudomonas lurida]
MILFEGKEFISPKTEDDIFDSALNAFAKTSKITDTNLPATLLESINTKLKVYIAKNKKIFLIASSISINGRLPIKKFITNEIEIKIYQSGLPKKFKHREQYDKLWKHSSPHTPLCRPSNKS